MYKVTLLDKSNKLQVSQCLDLLKQSFNKSLDYYNWKHNINENFQIEEYTFCIFHNNLCIATTQVIVSQMNKSNALIRYGLLCDGATHKDYRRLGLFEKLLSHINVFCANKEVTFVNGTGNEKSRKAFLKLGFEDFFTTVKASKKVRYNHPLLKIYNILLNNFGNFKTSKFDNIKSISIAQYANFNEIQNQKYNIYFEKTEDYLKWRLQEPGFNYSMYGAFDDDQNIQALMVLKTAKDLIYIVDVMYKDDIKYLNQLIKYCSSLAIKDTSIFKINSIHNNFKSMKDIFVQNKFNLTSEGTSTLLFKMEPTFNISPLEVDNMHYMRIDKNE
jgi:hypothetical protein